MGGLPPHHDAYDSLGDIGTRESAAASSGSAFPVSLQWMVHGSLVCPVLCLGVPSGVDRGALDRLADDAWALASIGAVSWSVVYEFSQDLDPEECVARIELVREGGGVPDGAEVEGLHASVRIVAAFAGGEGSWPASSEFSELEIEFLPDMDLPLLHELASIGTFAITTPEAVVDGGSVTVLCDATGDDLPHLLHTHGMWDATLAADG
jgi:hypothetical protein